MRIPDFSPMLLVATLVAATAVGAVTPANAKDAPLSDIAYMAAARCQGLADGLGRDASALKRVVSSESAGRVAFVYDRAAEIRSEASREARRAGEDARRHLIAESDGACAQFVKPAQVAGG